MKYRIRDIVTGVVGAISVFCTMYVIQFIPLFVQ